MVPAFGHRSAALPVFSPRAPRFALSADCEGVTVGDNFQLMPAGGRTLPNLFVIELSSDCRPRASMGEPNFDAQANSLCLYQNDIGATACISNQWRGDQHPQKAPVDGPGT